MKINGVAILVVCVIIAGLVYWGVTEHKARIDAQQLSQADSVITDPSAPQVKAFTDDLKRNHSVYNVTENKIDGKLVAVSKTLLDSVAKQSNIKGGDVVDWKAINAMTEARALKAERIADSLKKTLYFSYADKNLNLKYYPTSSLDSAGHFDFKYNADLSVTTYTKRNKFLFLPIGAKMTYTDIYSNDPRTTINGLKTLSVAQRLPFFGFKLQAGGNYNFKSRSFVFGPAAQLDLGRLSLVGAYYYSQTDNTFQPTLGGRFDIFR